MNLRRRKPSFPTTIMHAMMALASCHREVIFLPYPFFVGLRFGSAYFCDFISDHLDSGILDAPHMMDDCVRPESGCSSELKHFFCGGVETFLWGV